MSPIAERIDVYRQYRNLQKAQMARALNVEPANFGAMLKGNRSVTMEVCEAFLNVYSDVSAEWFMRGTGEMLTSERPPFKYMSDNKENFSRNNDNTAMNKLLNMLAAKDERIKELTDKLLGMI